MPNIIRVGGGTVPNGKIYYYNRGTELVTFTKYLSGTVTKNASNMTLAASSSVTAVCETAYVDLTNIDILRMVVSGVSIPAGKLPVLAISNAVPDSHNAIATASGDTSIGSEYTISLNVAALTGMKYLSAYANGCTFRLHEFFGEEV